MLSPAKYTVRDANDNYVTTVWAEKATNYIDPNTVSVRIENVTTVMDEQITLIQNALSAIVDDANQAIVVQSTSMGPQIEELVEALETFKGTPGQSLESVYTASVTAHDSIQEQLNSNAYSTAASRAGATGRVI